MKSQNVFDENFFRPPKSSKKSSLLLLDPCFELIFDDSLFFSDLGVLLLAENVNRLLYRNRSSKTIIFFLIRSVKMIC